MADDYVQKFMNLPPFTNDDDKSSIVTSISETFKALNLTHNTDFCRRRMLITFDDCKQWDKMLYIYNDGTPLLAFFSTLPTYTVFIDCYGNFYSREARLLKSVGCTIFHRYYNSNKIFTLPELDPVDYLLMLKNNFILFGHDEAAALLEIFVETVKVENAMIFLKKLKIFSSFFRLLTRNFEILEEFSLGDSIEMLSIKFVFPESKKEMVVVVNIEKLIDNIAYLSFVRQMWRIDDDNAEKSIKEEAIKDILPKIGYSTDTIDNYMIAMNRNFTDEEEFLTKCNTVAERISQEVFKGSIKLSHFKNIVLWLRERLSDDDEPIDEVINEYRYFFNLVKRFEFKTFWFSSIFSAAFHIYKHFDNTINSEIFKNYKRTLNLPLFPDKSNIFAELTKNRRYGKLLKECFYFYFNIVPTKLFKHENLIYTYTCGEYHALNYATEDLVGAQFKFGYCPLKVATMYRFIPEEKE